MRTDVRRVSTLVLLALAACGAETKPEAPAQVPAAWRDVRESPNHQLHLKADVRCADCHRSTDYKDVRIAACAACHPKPPEGIHAMEALTRTSTARVSEGGCDSCHAFREPHPKPTLPCLSCHAGARGTMRAIEGHTEETCLACHGPHMEKVQKKPACLSCHVDRSAAHGVDAHACDRCHGPHDPKGTAQKSCAGCHAREAPIVTAGRAIPKHKDCMDCHAPHDTANGGLKTCESCHEDEAKALARTNPSSDRIGHGCIGCHPPHTPRSAPTPAARQQPRACASCHTQLAPEGWAHAPRALCTDCHTPHVPPSTLR